jgi:hypothetical protein
MVHALAWAAARVVSVLAAQRQAACVTLQRERSEGVSTVNSHYKRRVCDDVAKLSRQHHYCYVSHYAAIIDNGSAKPASLLHVCSVCYCYSTGQSS